MMRLKRMFAYFIIVCLWCGGTTRGYATEPLMATGPVKEPSLQAEQIIKWASNTSIVLFTYNFQNVDQTIQNLRPYFTDDGFQAFQQALQASPWLPMIQRKKWDVLPILYGTPKILAQGVEQGAYEWSMEVPLVLHLRGPFETGKQYKMITLTVKRASLSEYSSGLAVKDFKMREMPGTLQDL